MTEESALNFRMTASIAALEKVLARAEGRVVATANKMQREFTRANEGVTKGTARAAEGLSRATMQMSQLGVMSSQTRASMQNAAAQFQDIGVTAASGMNPLLIALQQGTQLSAAFAGQSTRQALGGLVGAFTSIVNPVSLVTIALVAGAAALVQWAMKAVGAGGETEKFADVIKRANASIDRMRELSHDLSDRSLKELRQRYGEVTAEVLAMVEAQKKAEEIQARRDLGASMSSIRSQFGETWRQWLAGLTDGAGAAEREANNLIESIRDRLSLTEQEAYLVGTALVAAFSATSAEDQADALSQVSGYLGDIVARGGDGADAAFELQKNVLAAEDAARQLAAVDIVSGISGAADEALRLYYNMSAAVPRFTVGHQAGTGYTLSDGSVYTPPSVKVSGGGRRGAGGGGNRDVEEAKRVIADTRTEAEKLAIEMEKLQRLRDAGLIDVETFKRAKEALSGVNSVAKDVASSIRSAFDGLFDDPAAALKNLAKQLAQMALYMQLSKSFPSVFGAGGIIPLGFASGGYTGHGGVNQPAGVVHRGEVVWSQSDVSRAGGVAAVEAMRRGVMGYAYGGVVGASPVAYGRGGGVQIIDQRSASAPPIESQVTRGPNGREMVTMVVREEMTKGAFDKSMRGRYGARPDKVVR